MSQPQPGPYPYYPPQNQQHSHDRFIVAIIIGIVVTAIVVGGIAYGVGFGVGSLARTASTSSLQQQAFTYTWNREYRT